LCEAQARISVPSTLKSEMLVGQQLCLLGLLHHLPEQRTHHLVLDQSIPILGIGAVIPSRVVHAQADKPAVQQVVAQLLTQQPLASNAVQRLQNQPSQQPLRRHRVATTIGVDRLKQHVHIVQRTIENVPDHPERMICRHKIRRLPGHEQAFLRHIGSTHRRHTTRIGSTMTIFDCNLPVRKNAWINSTNC
jgi:hypothetical protein